MLFKQTGMDELENKKELVKTQENSEDDKNKTSKLGKILKEIAEWIICFIIAYIIYLVLNYFVGTISGVKQVSMLPTAVEVERLLIQRPTIFKKELNYGDIITFEAPLEDIAYNNEEENVIAQYEEHKGIDSFIYNFIGLGKMSYIKRVIGLPGDHIFVAEDGYVYRNDERLEEPYLKDGTTNQAGSFIDIVVPDGTIFAMGDNRYASKDSRYFGCIPLDKVNGYVICRIWPLNKLGKL